MRPLAPPSLAIVALAGALLAAARPAAADDKPPDKATAVARSHFEQGEKLFALGRFDKALVQYEAAFEARPLPGFLFNIGQCHRNLGDYDAAIFSFHKYLELSPDADNRDAVLALIDELEQQKADAAARAAKEHDAHRFEPPPPAHHHPLYTRWWFWGGLAAVAGASAGTYLLLRDDGRPNTDLGNVVFR